MLETELGISMRYLRCMRGCWSACVCWLLGVDVCVVLLILIEFRFKPVTHTRCRSRGRHPLPTSALDCALIVRRSRGYV